MGEGEEKLSGESFSSPSPNPTLSSPKTFIKWGGHATGVRSGGRLWEQRAR